MAYNQLDSYHRAFKEYKREVDQNAQASKLHSAICRTPVSRESMQVSRYECEIMTDWIEYIEEHLIYLEKAILENRQFILQQGETLLIEKAKRVSKTSVEHLAQHSELITHVPEPGEDLIPDKLYVVENDSNFAVYENRFLYMLLLDLSDFIEGKYVKIVEWWSKYQAELLLEKEVSVGKRKIEFHLSFKEENLNNADTTYDEKTRQVLTRINQLQGSVAALIQTPLMREVSHAPLIKPPITRTNVLKMDTNFRMAVELYDYLCAYEADGFIVTECGEKTDRLSDVMTRDYAELVALSSYLTYRYGGQLNEQMEARYEQENRRLFGEENERRRAELEALKRKIASGECTAEQYMQVLESRNEELEQDRAKMIVLEQQLAEQQERLHTYAQNEEILRNNASDAQAQLREQQAINAHQAAAHRAELAQMQERHDQDMALQQSQYDELEQTYLATQARLRALRQQLGQAEEEDLSSKEMLCRLEKERKAFDRLFEQQWRAAKKQIRTKAFGMKAKAVTQAEQTADDAKEAEE